MQSATYTHSCYAPLSHSLTLSLSLSDSPTHTHAGRYRILQHVRAHPHHGARGEEGPRGRRLQGHASPCRRDAPGRGTDQDGSAGHRQGGRGRDGCEHRRVRRPYVRHPHALRHGTRADQGADGLDRRPVAEGRGKCCQQPPTHARPGRNAGPPPHTRCRWLDLSY